MKTKMNDFETGVYKNIKWEKRTHCGNDCSILLHLKHVDDEFLHSLGLSKSSLFLNEGLYYLGVFNKVITEIETLYPIIDQIHDHILTQYELGGSKYLESEKVMVRLNSL